MKRANTDLLYTDVLAHFQKSKRELTVEIIGLRTDLYAARAAQDKLDLRIRSERGIARGLASQLREAGIEPR